MRRNVVLLFAFLVVLLGFLGFVVDAVAQPKIQYVAAQAVLPPHGPEVYRAYCSSCHGITARGNGPAAPLLGEPVPDLTMIAARDGRFDRSHVIAHVNLGPDAKPMPDWPTIMRTTYQNSPGAAHLAVRNVVVYVETLQVKP
jgi:hypothetical protein